MVESGHSTGAPEFMATRDPSLVIGLLEDAVFVGYVNGVLEQYIADGRWKASHDRWLVTVGVSPTPPVTLYGRRA
jgi:ABC-type amino acid transport substrate-binding protein